MSDLKIAKFQYAEAVRFELTDPVKSLLFSRQVP